MRVRCVAVCLVAILAVALTGAAPATAYPFGRTLQRGDRGRAVKALNVRVAGWYPNRKQKKLRLNRRFGARTVKAVKAMQRHYGLAVDGIAGPQTFAVLDRLEDRNGSTSHFDYKEFKQNRSSSCGSQANAYSGTFGGGMVSPRRVRRYVRRLMWRMEAIRAKGGSHAIGISSAFRSVKYNRCIGGASLSQHMYGTAADNRMARVSNRRERKLARRSQISGIGCYASLSHNHFDTRLDNRQLPSSRSWWWPKKDSKGRDLDANGKLCWGEKKNNVPGSVTSEVLRAVRSATIGAGSLIPTRREIRAFRLAGEPGDLHGGD